MLRRVFYPLIFICMVVGLPLQAIAQDGPEQVLTDVSQNVLQAVRENQGTYEDAPEVLQKQLLGLLDPVVDFNAFSRGVMGPYYKQATAEQRDAFMSAFKTTLSELYTSALVASEIKDISVLEKTSKKPGRANVAMKAVSGNNNSYTLQYNMRQGSDGQWRIRNIILDGVNVGLTYRNQFKSAMETENQDLARVITLWPQIIEGN